MDDRRSTRKNKSSKSKLEVDTRNGNSNYRHLSITTGQQKYSRPEGPICWEQSLVLMYFCCPLVTPVIGVLRMSAKNDPQRFARKFRKHFLRAALRWSIFTGRPSSVYVYGSTLGCLFLWADFRSSNF